MNFRNTLLSALLVASFLNCYSQQKKIDVSTTAHVLVTPSTTNADIFEQPKSFFAPVESGDINDALDLLGINICSIKLPVKNYKKYTIIVYADNYVQNKAAVKRKNEFSIVNGQIESNKNLSLTIVKTGDSSLIIKWKAPDGSTRTSENPRGRLSGLEYRVLPFMFQEILPGKKIPILLLGSSWFDPKINAVRFCSDFELNPDLSNDAFKYMPQYYIFSIEINEQKD